MASNTDLLLAVGNPGTATTLSAPGYTAGASSITVGSTTSWATTTGVVFAIDEAEVIEDEEVQKPGTYNEYIGTVTDGTTVTNVDWVNGVGDRDYAAGPLTRVYIPVSAERENRLVTWGLTHADQDGTLKAGAVDTSAVLADGVVSTAKVAGGAITSPKFSTTAGELGGAPLDYFSSSTKVGWSSPTGKIFYTVAGRLVYVMFDIQGTSNSTAATFTLPFPPLELSPVVSIEFQLGLAFDNGVGVASTRAYYDSVAGILRTDRVWTASGQKQIRGQFFYWKAS